MKALDVIEYPSNFTIYRLHNLGSGRDVEKLMKEHPGQYLLVEDDKNSFFKTKSDIIKRIKQEYGSLKDFDKLTSLCDVYACKLHSSIKAYEKSRKQPFFVAKWY